MSQPAPLPTYYPSAVRLQLPFFTVSWSLHTSRAKMASGVKVADKVVDFFKDMKIAKNEEGRVRVATFDFIEDFIDVGDTTTQAELDVKQMDAFEFFKSLLSPDKCRYILYDCHFATKESSTKEELVFVMWCSETSKPKDKMNYAASKENLIKKLPGIKHNFQFNDLADCPDRNVFAGKLGKTVTSLEGVPVFYDAA
ncbi:non-muscle cofilin 1-like [Takifugu flavidus]|uniref:ADF-H domain-containing protein n=1 Tax=Takifugu flavidus TaxID=433684 RepID=A0A5C6PII6_9TELE|nr:non-muscle cofilin 1-like [Takifugu flavidus]TWW78701.1 hypothetical protein D4764_11G0008220 [Takifugu flavidus]